MFSGVKYGYMDEYTAPLILELTRRFALNDDAAQRDPEYFNKLIRNLLPPRGARFSHDHHDTCVYIERSKNANIVAYTVNLVDAQTGQAVESGVGRTCKINEKNPIHGYFINIEPSYLARRRQMGIKTDCDDLKLIERKLAYGCNAHPLYLGSLPAELCALERSWKKEAVSERMMMWWRAMQPFHAPFVALPSQPVVLLRLSPLSAQDTSSTKESFAHDDTVVVAVSLIDKELSILCRIYVKSVEPKHFYHLPTVEYIELFGISLESGKETYEKIMH